MNPKDLTQQTADKVGVSFEVAEANVRALFEAFRHSIARFEPVKIPGIMDINLHKYIFDNKIRGKELAMPEGVGELLKVQKTHNSSYPIGGFVKYQNEGIFIGLVHKKVGDDGLIVYPLLQFESKTIKRRNIYTMTILDKSEPLELTKEMYRGSVRRWLNQIEGSIQPVISTKGVISKLYQMKKMYI